MRRYRRPVPNRWCSCRRAPPRRRCSRRRRHDAPRPGRSRTRADSRTPRCARPPWGGITKRSGETTSRESNRTQQQQTSQAAHSVLTASRFRTSFGATAMPDPSNRHIWSRATSLSRLLDLQPEFADGLLAHHELLDLAGDGHREVRHELDVARDLVVGDLALAELADLLGRRALAVAQLDPGADLLAVLRIGHADHLHVLHLGMPVEELLDLARIDVLAAPDHHVLQAADDVDVALLIHGGEVSGVHPAAVVDRLGRL